MKERKDFCRGNLPKFPLVPCIVCLIIIFILLVLGLSDSNGAEKDEQFEQALFEQALMGVSHTLETSLFFIHSESGKRAISRHPELKDFNIKKFDEAWESLSIDGKRKLIEMQVQKTRQNIFDTIDFLIARKASFPFRGLGIEFSATPFNAVHMASVIRVERILRGSPAVRKLQSTDFILAVDKERFDTFDPQKFEARESIKNSMSERGKANLRKEIEEKYTSRFFETIKNSEGPIKLEILRNHDRDDEKKLTVEVEAVNIGEDFPEQIGKLGKEYFSKVQQSFTSLKILFVDSKTVPEKDLKDMFEKAFLFGFHEKIEAIKKYNEIVYEK